MNKQRLLIYLLSGSLCILSCSKKEKTFDDRPSENFTATLTFTPENGVYATNQNAATISNISLTAITSTNFGIDSMRKFEVSFNGVLGTTTSKADYVLYVFFKAPKVDEKISSGAYLTSINKNSSKEATAGALYIRNTNGPVTWSGSYPSLSFSNLPYARVTITNSYSRNLQDGIHKYVDGTIDAYFVQSGFNNSSEVHVTATFSGTETLKI